MYAMRQVTIKPQLTVRFVMFLSVGAMMSFPVFWVFVLQDGSMLALIISVLGPFLVDLYLMRRNTIKISNDTIFIRSRFLRHEKSIRISAIQRVEVKDMQKNPVRITLAGKETAIPSSFLETREVIQLLHSIKSVNPNVLMPVKYVDLVNIFENNERFAMELRKFDALASRKTMAVIFSAVTLALCYWMFLYFSGAKYSMRDIVDVFVHSF